MKPIYFVVWGLAIALPCFLSYRIGVGNGYLLGHRENKRYYNLGETGHRIEQALELCHDAQAGNMSNVVRISRANLQEHVSRYRQILSWSRPSRVFPQYMEGGSERCQ